MSPRAPFSQTPRALRYHPTLSAGAKRLWELLDDLARDEATIHRSVAATSSLLAGNLRCSVATLRRHRVELVKAGWLEHEATRGGRGLPSLWTPLHRVRQPVDNSPIEVGNPLRTRSPVSGFDLGNPLTGERVSRGGSNRFARGEEEEAHTPLVVDLRDSPATPAGWPRWCQRCHPSMRLLLDEYGLPDATRKCPDCHPYAPRPAF